MMVSEIIVNVGVVFRIDLEKIKIILKFIEKQNGEIIFIKKSVSKLFIQETEHECKQKL